MSFSENPSAFSVRVQMLIRKPAVQVYEAFIDPAVTSNFWFTRSSGRLEEGKTVKWEWEMYGASAEVKVIRLLPEKLISTRWGEPATTVEYEFYPVDPNSTCVVIRNYGFVLEGNELLQAVMDNTGGFTTVLDGLKAFLEHGISLNLVGDKFPANVPGLTS